MVTGKKQQTKVKAAAPKASKVVKGKAKAKVAPSAPVKEPSPEEDDEDDEDDFEDDSEDDEDEDNGGISEKGMKRLMELVGPEDLDEFEIAQLAGSDEGEDEDQEDDEEDDDEEDEEEEEETAEVSYTITPLTPGKLYPDRRGGPGYHRCRRNGLGREPRRGRGAPAQGDGQQWRECILLNTSNPSLRCAFLPRVSR